MDLPLWHEAIELDGAIVSIRTGCAGGGTNRKSPDLSVLIAKGLLKLD
jgi:hypothetical protein